MSQKVVYVELVNAIQQLLHQNRQKVARVINNTVISTYWQIGHYIVEYEQNGADRAKYGSSLLEVLAQDLTLQFGKGFSNRNLRLFRQLYLTFPIWQSLIAKSENAILQSANVEFTIVEKALLKASWTHLVQLLSIKNEAERNFYLIESTENNWTVRELNRQIDSGLFERLIATKDENAIKSIAAQGHQLIHPTDILKDPYILEFLGLQDNSAYSENDLETSIINNLGTFILELGKGFSFVARQYRISSGSEHFYIDLVFYNRLLKCHVLFDLKIGKLKHQDIGQMQMYVNYFDREIKTDFENLTIGIILCKEKNDFVVEFSLPKDNKQIYPKEYLLYLPNKEELKQLLLKYC